MDRRVMFSSACITRCYAEVEDPIMLVAGGSVHFVYHRPIRKMLLMDLVVLNIRVDKTIAYVLDGCDCGFGDQMRGSGLFSGVPRIHEIAETNIFNFMTFTYDDKFCELFMLMDMGYDLQEAVDMLC